MIQFCIKMSEFIALLLDELNLEIRNVVERFVNICNDLSQSFDHLEEHDVAFHVNQTGWHC